MKIKATPEVVYIAQTLKDAGFHAHLVGGGVRDQLLGMKAKDHDLCTDARPEDVIRLFRKVIPTGIKHGTVTVLLSGRPHEITTYRIDGTYSDGRRPDTIDYTDSLDEDLKRRDFTINSIAWDPLTQKEADPNKGKNDLKKRLIRAIGKPEERFQEDGLRMIRACRFASQLNFTIHEDTLRAMKSCLSTLQGLSSERIYDELVKILKTERPSRAFRLFRETGILQRLLPELDDCYGILQKESGDLNVFEHLIRSCDAAPAGNRILRFAALFHSIGKGKTKTIIPGEPSFCDRHKTESAAMARNIMERYRFPKKDSAQISHLIENQRFHYSPEWTDPDARRFIRKIGLDQLDNLYRLWEAHQKAWAGEPGKEDTSQLEALKCRMITILEQSNAFTLGDLAVNGREIMEKTGLTRGPEVGKVLNYLLEKVLDDPAQNTKECLINLGIKYLNQSS